MPNWCSNVLEVNGEDKDIKKFYEENRVEDDDDENDIQKTELSFRNSVPFSKGTWDYNEAVRIWGTKWDTNDVDVNIDEEYLRYNFQTAWAPPREWLEKVAIKYPQLNFTLDYEEPGMDFMGKLVFENGECIEDMQDEYTSYHMRENGLYDACNEIIQKLFTYNLATNLMNIYDEKVDIEGVYDFESFMDMNENEINPYYIKEIQSNPIKLTGFNEIREIFDNLDEFEHRWMVSSHIKSLFEEKYKPLQMMIQKLYQKIKMNHIRKQIHQKKSKLIFQKIQEYGFLPDNLDKNTIQQFTEQPVYTIFTKGGPLFHEIQNSICF
jgi:hypothetical protein